MRRIGFCYSEQAVKVSSPHSSSKVRPDLHRLPIPSSDPNPPSTRPDATTNSYRVFLSSGKRILIDLTWVRRTTSKQGFSVAISEYSGFAGDPIVLRMPRGTEIQYVRGSKIEVYWDLSRAEYDYGPEPVGKFYVVILIDSETGLGLGDMGRAPTVEKRVSSSCSSEFKLISRCDIFSGGSGGSCYSTTRAKFSDEGKYHDILIEVSGGMRNSKLCVYVDRKSVAQVKGLRWNFRGNQTVFVDGLVVDLMWDVHDWFFGRVVSSSSGRGVFLFRRRNGLDSRLWMEEKTKHGGDEESVGFSLIMICECM